MWLPAITEKRISETDSTALWVLRDSLQEQQRQIAHTESHVTTAVHQHTDQSVLQEAITRAQTNLSAASAKQSRELIDLKEKTNPPSFNFNFKLLLAGVFLGILLMCWFHH